LFRVNDNNFYTHTDLNYALNHLKYKLEMIEDGEDNAMIYSNLKSARSTFKPFVDYLFNFKNQGVKEVKKYLNALWGMMAKTNTIDVKANDIFENKEIFSMMPNYNDLREDENMENHIAKVYTRSKYYEFAYARISHFILASGRLKISNIIRPNVENVVQIHTDYTQSTY